LPPPKLTITPVPLPARGLQAYWAELLMILGIVVYMLNYIMGRYKNQRIAQSFFDINWSILEDNFTLLGDTTILEDDQGTRNYQKMSDSIYQMWCSGRVCCEGMLLELKLLKVTRFDQNYIVVKIASVYTSISIRIIETRPGFDTG